MMTIEKTTSMRAKLTTAALALFLVFGAKAQLFDTTGIGSWPLLTNSYESWSVGAFNQGRDVNDPADFGWGNYNLATHLIEGDSIYILKTVQGNYKAISIDGLASGVFTITYSDLDGGNKTTKLLDRSPYGAKNFFYYSLDSEIEKDLEPITDNWDILFTKYLISFPGFGFYPVTGVLHNRNVRVSQVEKDSGVSASVTDTIQFPLSDNISTIGYDWKDAGPQGIRVFDTLTYFVRDQYYNINELRFTGYSGSGTGKIFFTVNGQPDSVVMGAGNTDEIYYSLENKGSAGVNQDKDWDLAFFAQSSFTAIPVRINDVGGAELYIYPRADIFHWNTADLEENELSLLSVYPNPARDMVNLALNAEMDRTASVSFMNLGGQVIAQRQFNILPGMAEIELSTEDLPSGVYLLQLESGSYRAVTRLVVER